jgi:hypothetical protein
MHPNMYGSLCFQIHNIFDLESHSNPDTKFIFGLYCEISANMILGEGVTLLNVAFGIIS